MKKIFALAVLVVSALPVGAQFPYLEQRKSLFELLPVTSKDIVFLGNSITNGCEWAELFGNKNMKNRGVNGDQAVYLPERIDPIVEGRPKKLFLMIGTNDLSAGTSVERIVESVDTVVERFRNESPKTEVYIQSVFPVDLEHPNYANAQDRNDRIVELNRRLEELCCERSVIYVDVHSYLKDENGNLRKDVSNDGLHLMGEGYLIWKRVLLPYVK